MTRDLGAPRTGATGVSPTGEAPPEGTLPLEWGAPQDGDARRQGEPPQDAEDLERPDGLPGDDGAERPPPTPARRAWGAVFEWLVVGVCALGLALLLKAFLVEVFVIPSGSMEPTLMVDNRVVVYKLGYRFHDVNRGDVVVFHQPGQTAQADDLIKRVVGLGGETVEIRGGHVYVDGTRLEEPYLARAESTYPAVPIPGCANAGRTGSLRSARRRDPGAGRQSPVQPRRPLLRPGRRRYRGGTGVSEAVAPERPGRPIAAVCGWAAE